MPIKPNVRTGNVDWTGENPGMLLKTDPRETGQFSCFFPDCLVTGWSGNILLLYETLTKM